MKTIQDLKSFILLETGKPLGDVVISNLKIVEKCLYKGRCSRTSLQNSIAEQKSKTTVSEKTVQNCIKYLNFLYDGDNKISKTTKHGDGPRYSLQNYENLCFPETALEDSRRDAMRLLLRLASMHQIPVRKLFNELHDSVAESSIREYNDGNLLSLGLSKEPFSGFARIFSRLFDAIDKKEIVSLEYKLGGKYLEENEDKVEHKNVSPLMLRLYNNRWYLIAHEHKHNPYDWSIFPLDRIKSIAKYEGEKKYYEIDSKVIDEYYSKVIGFDIPPAKVKSDSSELNRRMRPEDLRTTHIELGFSNNKAYMFVKKNPVCQSQVCSDEDMTIKLDLVENDALYLQLIRFAPDIKYITPEEVKDELLGRLNGVMQNIAKTNLDCGSDY